MATTPKATVQVQGIALTGTQPVKPYRAKTARALYWASISLQLAKGPVPTATVATTWLGAPPSTPRIGKLAGKPEPAAGWLAYFVRQGVCKYVTLVVPAK